MTAASGLASFPGGYLVGADAERKRLGRRFAVLTSEPKLEIAIGIWARTLLTVCPFTMAVIVPFLTTARTEFTSVGPALTRLLFAGVSHTVDYSLLTFFESLTKPS